MNSLWKSSKTAWNPTVHVNNMFGNVILSDLADVPLFRGVDGEELAKGVTRERFNELAIAKDWNTIKKILSNKI